MPKFNGWYGSIIFLYLIVLSISYGNIPFVSNSFAKEIDIPPTLPRIHFQDVVLMAKKLSAEPFKEQDDIIPEPLTKIGYDQWRDIRFKPAKSLWPEGPYQVQLFHPGFIYHHPVRVNYIDRSGTHSIPFSTELFDYAYRDYRELLTKDIGFAGLRIHYPLNTPTYADELVSFLGASYFRALGKNLAYGLSARGLAINTAEATGEEFPFFKEFWIVRPLPGSKDITIYALLDSPSISGAYEFEIRPGEETIMQVKTILFVRKRIQKLGIAPLTSMFYYGKHSGFKGSSDFRPEVHDSDGLLIHDKSGEWIWHPLINPERLVINSFGGGLPSGFGLLQRETNFDHYQDLEARYDRRPSTWVVPQNDWGKGHLELLQIPTVNEYNDNIGAYWVPERAFEPGQTLNFSYTLCWYSGKLNRSALATIEATRLVRKTDDVMFLVDFVPDANQPALLQKEPTAEVQLFNDYHLLENQVIRNPITGGWRLVIKVRIEKNGFFPDLLPNQPATMELRAWLKDGDKPISETWSFTYLP